MRTIKFSRQMGVLFNVWTVITQTLKKKSKNSTDKASCWLATGVAPECAAGWHGSWDQQPKLYSLARESLAQLQPGLNIFI